MVALELTGKRFGRYTVLGRDCSRGKGKSWWICECSCGTKKVVVGSELTSGNTLSCGCYGAERRLESLTKHNSCKTKEYLCWAGMKSRCYNINDNRYFLYGARGITVCEEWFEFSIFLKDMGLAPTVKHSIDRINNDLGYYKENCRWATAIEQANNTRRNKRFVFRGRDHTISELLPYSVVPYATLIQRLGKLGWTAEEAVSRPASPLRR